mmetsp:Transcript_21014/g.64018  ORF Transcript_21014/g.64018 Transcript_21014/m.64018 type:complete len:226 (+) Transcript_21014:1366-2043(+)
MAHSTNDDFVRSFMRGFALGLVHVDVAYIREGAGAEPDGGGGMGGVHLAGGRRHARHKSRGCRCGEPRDLEGQEGRIVLGGGGVGARAHAKARGAACAHGAAQRIVVLAHGGLEPLVSGDHLRALFGVTPALALKGLLESARLGLDVLERGDGMALLAACVLELGGGVGERLLSSGTLRLGVCAQVCELLLEALQLVREGRGGDAALGGLLGVGLHGGLGLGELL